MGGQFGVEVLGLVAGGEEGGVETAELVVLGGEAGSDAGWLSCGRGGLFVLGGRGGGVQAAVGIEGVAIEIHGLGLALLG